MSSTAMNADATLPYLEDYSGGAQRPFDGEHFLFSEIDDGIHLIDADGSPSNHNHPEYGVQPRPVVTDDGYAFTRRSGEEMDGPVELFTYAANTAEAEPVTETEATESHPYGDDGDLYWRSDDGVYRRPDGGDPARLLEGNCTPPHASDGRAAFACTDDEDAQWEGLQTPAADELHVFDGNRTRKIHSVSDGAYVFAPRISSEGVAWIEYDDRSVTCNSDKPGRIMFHDPAGGDTVEVGSIGAPCMCCDAYSPPVQFDLDDNVLVWNHDRSSGGGGFGGDDYAYAILTERGGC